MIYVCLKFSLVCLYYFHFRRHFILLMWSNHLSLFCSIISVILSLIPEFSISIYLLIHIILVISCACILSLCYNLVLASVCQNWLGCWVAESLNIAVVSLLYWPVYFVNEWLYRVLLDLKASSRSFWSAKLIWRKRPLATICGVRIRRLLDNQLKMYCTMLL